MRAADGFCIFNVMMKIVRSPIHGRRKKKSKSWEGGEAQKYAIWSNVLSWYCVKELQVYGFIHFMFS